MHLLSPSAIRRCFIADPGMLIISADFDQIELRVAAALAGEQLLIDAAKRGDSLHKATAVELFGREYTADQYRYTKNLNFGWLYGGGPETLAKQTGLPLDVATKIVVQYTARFSALTAYKHKCTADALASGVSTQELKALRKLQTLRYSYRRDTADGIAAITSVQREIQRMLYGKTGYVTNPFGRRLVVDLVKAYAATNYVVQSTARDLMAQALLDVMADPQLEPTVLLPIHDEILGQAPRQKAKRIVTHYATVMSREFMGVPITASGKVCGKSWGHAYR